MSRITVLCPHCGREGKLPEAVKTLPKRVRCPGCQRDFQPASAGPDEFTVVPGAAEQLRESAKRVAVAIGDGVKQTAKKAKDYAESDDAKAAMASARRRAEEVGSQAKEVASAVRGSGARFLENPIVIGMSMLFCFPGRTATCLETLPLGQARQMGMDRVDGGFLRPRVRHGCPNPEGGQGCFRRVGRTLAEGEVDPIG